MVVFLELFNNRCRILGFKNRKECSGKEIKDWITENEVGYGNFEAYKCDSACPFVTIVCNYFHTLNNLSTNLFVAKFVWSSSLNYLARCIRDRITLAITEKFKREY